ncbi:MAG: response regulator transcription factor [Eubacteriales bacterium]|nr:response regulator transcription factor [Eubacteriales bacterium]
MTNVLIVDDERIVQELFASYIEKAKDRYSLAGMLKDAGNVDVYCAGGRIGMILMDVCTANEQSGIAAAARVKKKYPWIKIVIVTSAPDYRFLEKAREAGADSFWYKEVSKEELLSVMDRTMAGEHVYPEAPPEVYLGLARSTEFTPKELELLGYLLTNKSLHEIADIMGVDYSTTRYHVKNLKEKTGAKSVVELCYLALKSRMILPEY